MTTLGPGRAFISTAVFGGTDSGDSRTQINGAELASRATRLHAVRNHPFGVDVALGFAILTFGGPSGTCDTGNFAIHTARRFLARNGADRVVGDDGGCSANGAAGFLAVHKHPFGICQALFILCPLWAPKCICTRIHAFGFIGGAFVLSVKSIGFCSIGVVGSGFLSGRFLIDTLEIQTTSKSNINLGESINSVGSR